MKILIIAVAWLFLLPTSVQAQNPDEKFQEALDLAGQGLALHKPNDPKSMKSARDFYLKALKVKPDMCHTTPQLCANLGHAEYILGNLDPAIGYFRKALENYPEYGTPYYGLGRVYESMNLLGFAFEAYLKAYFIDRTDLESRTKAASIFYKFCESTGAAEDVGGAKVDQKTLENKLLIEKAFSEWNRRLFYCDRKNVKVEFVMRDITFEPAKAVLKKTAFKQVDLLGRILKEHNEFKVIIEGHTDSTPFVKKSVEVSPGVFCRNNFCLSKARAQAVKAALVERFKLDPGRIKVEAYGDSRPLDNRKTRKAKARNRRVTLVLDQK